MATQVRQASRVEHKLYLSVYLLLNALSSALCLVFPIHSKLQVRLAVVLILLFSLSLLWWQANYKNLFLNLKSVSLTIGLLWALHIFNNYQENDDRAFELSTLLSVVAIGAISFFNNISGFLLHTLPVVFTVFWWCDVNRWLLLYFILLPSIGITFHFIFQNHYDRFTQHLVNRLEEEREILSSLSMLDPLTGLYNRRGFQNRLGNIQGTSGSHYVLLVDVDHFKLYNDNYGHAMGDQALVRISKAILQSVRRTDIVSRYGGEEFIVLLSNIDRKLALGAAERIRLQVYELGIPHSFNSQVAEYVTVSIGMAPLVGENIGQAVILADKALYTAKRLGRNSILSYEMD